MSKPATLLLIAVLVLSSYVMVGCAFAQSGSKPAIPEFTVEFVNHPYDVPTTYSIDEYTGENITHAGYSMDNYTVNIVIKNPFNYSYSNMGYYLFYNVRVRGHFSEEWDTLYYYYSYAKSSEYTPYKPNWLAADKNSEYTTTSHPANYLPGAQLDFQVQAVPIYSGQVKVSSHLFDFTGHYEPGYVVGEASDWSATQTLVIPPRVTLLLPQYGNFSNSDVPLDFVVDGHVSEIEYCLDGGENVTVSGDVTLTGLSNGVHNVTVYVSDEFGNTGASETIYFTVDLPFPTSLVIASVTVATVVLSGLGLLLYGIKRK